jgi:demethylmenaquinone methyltransferase/2-methoxy-6-polyprenyl-1,4-benzoquinol methylase
MMTSPRTRHARRLFATLPPTYDGVASVLSLGQDPRWRRFLVSRVPPKANDVLDVAAGTAAVAIELLRASERRRVVALDQSEPMLREGLRRATRAGVAPRLPMVLGQAERPPFAPESFDALTFTYLFRYVDDPATTLRGLVQVVKIGGTIASLEFGVPPNLVCRGAWWLYTRLVLPLAGRSVSRAWFEVGRFLGPSISGYERRHPLEDQVQMWTEAGIQVIGVRRMSFGGGVIIWGRRTR